MEVGMFHKTFPSFETSLPMVATVERSEDSPFFKKRSILEPPPVLFQDMTVESPAYKIVSPKGAVKELTAKAEAIRLATMKKYLMIN